MKKTAYCAVYQTIYDIYNIQFDTQHLSHFQNPGEASLDASRGQNLKVIIQSIHQLSLFLHKTYSKAHTLSAHIHFNGFFKGAVLVIAPVPQDTVQ